MWLFRAGSPVQMFEFPVYRWPSSPCSVCRLSGTDCDNHGNCVTFRSSGRHRRGEAIINCWPRSINWTRNAHVDFVSWRRSECSTQITTRAFQFENRASESIERDVCNIKDDCGAVESSANLWIPGSRLWGILVVAAIDRSPQRRPGS